jgi:hypothetical protein
MSGPIVRTGASPKFYENWTKAFGDGSKKKGKSAPAAAAQPEVKPAAKATAKKAAASAKPAAAAKAAPAKKAAAKPAKKAAKGKK